MRITIQFVISQRLVFENHCHGVGRFFGLCFKQFVCTNIRNWIRRVIPLFDKARVFRGRQQRNSFVRLVGIACH